MHMVLTGNPGTGKTTIARLISRIYKSLGVLSKGQFVETDRSGLVGPWIGHTEDKVQKVVSEALGGVLFIDEAYSLFAPESPNDFGREAIAILLKQMEDHRADLLVIVAGYTGPMETFIRSNPGLQSRFNRYIQFDDYTPTELLSIFQHFARKADYYLPLETKTVLLDRFTRLYAKRDEHFGNARDARNLFEEAIKRQAERILKVASIDKQTLIPLLPEDIIGNG